MKNTVEYGRQIIFFMCGLKYEDIYFNVMGFLQCSTKQHRRKKLNNRYISKMMMLMMMMVKEMI